MTYAQPWKRVIAFLIDLAIIACGVVFSQIILTSFTGISLIKGDRSGWFLAGWTLLTVSFPTWLYFIKFELWRQATPGKMLMRLIVADDDGHPLRKKRVVLRTFVKMFPFDGGYLTFFIPAPMFSEQGRGELRIFMVMIAGMMLVYLLMMTWNDAHQSMHDLIAESVVIDKGKPWRLFGKRRMLT